MITLLAKHNANYYAQYGKFMIKLFIISFHRYEDIVLYLETLAKTQGWLNVVKLGETFEGRDLVALEITKAGPGRPNVLIEGGLLSLVSSNNYSL